MNHAMADAQDLRAGVFRSQPDSEGIDSIASVADRVRQLFVSELLSVSASHGQSGRCTDTLDLAPRPQPPMLFPRPLEHAELEARRTCIQYQSIIVHYTVP